MLLMMLSGSANETEAFSGVIGRLLFMLQLTRFSSRGTTKSMVNVTILQSNRTAALKVCEALVNFILNGSIKILQKAFMVLED